MVSSKVAIGIGALIFFAFIAAGGGSVLTEGTKNFRKFTQDLGTGISERSKNIQSKLNGDKTNG